MLQLGLYVLKAPMKSERLNLRLSPKLRRRLRRASTRYDRTEADIIRDVLTAWLEKKEQKGGKPKK